MRGLILFVLLLAAAEAKLDFDDSTLYDMFDFKGTPQYPITNCAESGCRVYLTYSNDDCPRGNCLGDQDNGGFTIEIDDDNKITFFSLNKKRLRNGEKAWFDVPKGTAQFIIRNPNSNGVARPLALWVVRYDTPNLDDYEVYEAEEKGTITTMHHRIVLMSVSPFTVSGSVVGEYDLFAKTSPMDMMNNDKCEYVLEHSSTIGASFSLSVNSPILSLGFNSGGFTATMNTEHEFSFFRSIDSSGYLAAPGYIGCNNKTHVFRSESYNSNSGVNSYISGDKQRHVSFYGDLETDSTAPIDLIDLDNNREMKLVGNEALKTSTWNYELDTSKFAINFDNSFWRNETFMIRYMVDSPKIVSANPLLRAKRDV